MLKELLLAAVMAFTGEHIPEQYVIGDYIQPPEVYLLSKGEVNAICSDHAIPDPTADYTYGMAGCVIFSSHTFVEWKDRYSAKTCIVFIKSLDVLLHELAHCKGWPPNHPRN